MIRFFSFVISAVILASCIQTKNLELGAPLIANEGIVVTNCKTPNTISRYGDCSPTMF